MRTDSMVDAPKMLLALLSLGGTVIATEALALGPQGVWVRDDGNARVEFGPCDDKLCATNLWIKDTSGGEEVGDKLVMTVQPSNPTTLVGTAYDRKRDRTYALTITMGEKSMTTQGCVLGGLLCKTVSWTQEPQPAR